MKPATFLPFLHYCLFVTWMAVSPLAAFGQLTDWQQVGLQTEWNYRLPTQSSRTGEVQVTLFATGGTQKVYEVIDGDQVDAYYAGIVGRSGRVMSDNDAMHEADIDVRTRQALGSKVARLNIREVPEVLLLVQTGSGQLLVLDGETGYLRWSLTVGQHDRVNFDPAASGDLTAIVNGSRLFVINLVTGKLEYERQLRGAPDGGPHFVGQTIMVPMLGGPFEVYSLVPEERGRPPKYRASFGGLSGPPITAGDRVVWGTRRGHLNIAQPDSIVVEARIQTRSGIVGAPAYLPPSTVVAATEGGYLLAVDLQNELVLWEFFTGEELQTSPFAFADKAFVTSDGGTLYCVATSSGELIWQSPGMDHVVTATSSGLLCQAVSGRLVSLDLSTGEIVGQVDIRKDRALSNVVTDRVYLVRGNGSLECLRPMDARWPTLRIPVQAVAPSDVSSGKTAESKQDTSTNEQESPFAVDAGGADAMDGADDANPFVEGAEAGPPADTNDNPFEGGDDPFSGGDNPFSGGDNPFE